MVLTLEEKVQKCKEKIFLSDYTQSNKIVEKLSNLFDLDFIAQQCILCVEICGTTYTTSISETTSIYDVYEKLCQLKEKKLYFRYCDNQITCGIQCKRGVGVHD